MEFIKKRKPFNEISCSDRDQTFIIGFSVMIIVTQPT
jgi:hypothetical protein